MNSDISWLQKENIEDCQQQLVGLGGTSLSVRGYIPKCNLSIQGKTCTEAIYLLDNQRFNLLGKTAIQNLGLLQPSPEVYHVGTTIDVRSEYPKLFQGLGCLKTKTPYKIQLKKDAKPLRLYTPRKVAHPMMDAVKTQLEQMVKSGVISPITEPTEWCSGMVVVPKPNGKVRICVDLTQLNKNVMREVFPMSSVEDSLAKLQQGQVFSKLDANSGFWQIPLDPESRKLTCFITPYGRFCFNRLPFGISSAPEVFSRLMSHTLQDLPGIICHMDDVMVYGSSQQEHDSNLRAVLKRIQEAGLTLNEKCEFSKERMVFLGHVISPQGLQPDPRKLEAIRNYPAPTRSWNFSDLWAW
jgi:hypothetical protein